MNFPIYFYLTLLVISPWPTFYAFIFYYKYKFDTIFEYYISKEKQLYKFWLIILFLHLICSSIFVLGYNRIGISLDFIKIINFFLEIIAPLRNMDLCIIAIFMLLFIVTWILGLRLLYQHFRKCLLALYLYYYQYKKFMDFCNDVLFLRSYYKDYLWNRVKLFTANGTAFRVTRYIWPFFIDILERNLFRCILPYLMLYDFIIHEGVLSKIFIILPWYYVYSLVRFAFKFFYEIHKIENWYLAEEMYGDPK